MIFAIPISIIRQNAAGAYDPNTGKYQTPTTTTIPIRASVQPLGDREVQMMPQGEWEKEYIKIYSDQQLVSSEEAGLEPADVVQYNGKSYKVLKSRDYSKTIIPHFRSVAVVIGTAGV
jgi:hypothetical protein